jgi:hypothetical protein
VALSPMLPLSHVVPCIHTLKLPLYLNLELFHVVLSPVLPLSHVLPYFPILKLSSLYLVILRHPYFIHMKSDFGNI